jgi:hypothetical protein
MENMIHCLYLLKSVFLNNVIYQQYIRKVYQLVFVHYRLVEAINVDIFLFEKKLFFLYLAWVNATQAFMLMAYIFGMIFLGLMVFYRKEFRHNPEGYHADRVSQPRFTFIIAGLILFFCCKKNFTIFFSNNSFEMIILVLFSLIGIAIFGGEVFPNSLTVNWGYIVAVFAMVLFLIAGILLILDGIHSKKQTS